MKKLATFVLIVSLLLKGCPTDQITNITNVIDCDDPTHTELDCPDCAAEKGPECPEPANACVTAVSDDIDANISLQRKGCIDHECDFDVRSGHANAIGRGFEAAMFGSWIERNGKLHTSLIHPAPTHQLWIQQPASGSAKLYPCFNAEDRRLGRNEVKRILNEFHGTELAMED